MELSPRCLLPFQYSARSPTLCVHVPSVGVFFLHNRWNSHLSLIASSFQNTPKGSVTATESVNLSAYSDRTSALEISFIFKCCTGETAFLTSRLEKQPERS